MRGTIAEPSRTQGRRAAFVDRDGTIVVERDFLHEPDRVELIAGAATALRELRSAGYAVVVVTNQSGIGRGLFTLDDFWAVQRRLVKLLADAGARLDGTYLCPHYPEIDGSCECRKPGLRLFLQAAADLGLDLGASAYIGDRSRDVSPSLRLGGTGILVRTGYGAHESVPDGIAVATDLRAAASILLDQHRTASET